MRPLFERFRDAFAVLFAQQLTAAPMLEAPNLSPSSDTGERVASAPQTNHEQIFSTYKEHLLAAEVAAPNAVSKGWFEQARHLLEHVQASLDGGPIKLSSFEHVGNFGCEDCADRRQLNDLIGRIADRMDSCRNAQSELITSSIDLSQQEVSNASSNMGDLYQESVQQVADLKLINDQFSESSDSKNTFAAIVNRQALFVEELPAVFEGIQNQLKQQIEQATRVRDLSNEIRGFADTIRKIGFSAFLLSVNAQVIAAQASGPTGEAFSVVARDLKGLFTEVQSTNKSIEEMAKLMSTLLPEIAASAENVMKACGQQSQQVVQRVREFRRGYDASRAAFLDVIVQNGERSGRIHEKFNNILVHLQFQDRMTKMLIKATEHADGLAPAVRRAADALREGGTNAIAEATLALDAPVTTASAPAPDSGADAGELMLFGDDPNDLASEGFAPPPPAADDGELMFF